VPGRSTLETIALVRSREQRARAEVRSRRARSITPVATSPGPVGSGDGRGARAGREDEGRRGGERRIIRREDLHDINQRLDVGIVEELALRRGVADGAIPVQLRVAIGQAAGRPAPLAAPESAGMYEAGERMQGRPAEHGQPVEGDQGGDQELTHASWHRRGTNPVFGGWRIVKPLPDRRPTGRPGRSPIPFGYYER
jgi:hypothetical protein